MNGNLNSLVNQRIVCGCIAKDYLSGDTATRLSICYMFNVVRK